MLTELEASKLVADKLQQMSPADDLFVIVEQGTIERAFGWVFFFNSKKFLETGVFSYRLAGNGPVIVNKNTGSIDFFGTATSPLQIIEEYEQKLTAGTSRPEHEPG